MKEEKRRFSRIVFDIETQLTVCGEELTSKTITNLSAGGCLLPIPGKFPAGSPSVLTIRLTPKPDSPKVTVTGEIVRCDPAGIAVKFTIIDPESLFHLHNILRYNAADPERVEEEIQKHPGLI